MKIRLKFPLPILKIGKQLRTIVNKKDFFILFFKNLLTLSVTILVVFLVFYLGFTFLGIGNSSQLWGNWVEPLFILTPLFAAATTLGKYDKSKRPKNSLPPVSEKTILILCGIFALVVIVGFFLRN